MTTVTITLPESLFVSIRGAEPVETTTADIPESILAECVAYGWQQKNADAASAAARHAAVDALGSDATEKAVADWIKSDEAQPAILDMRRTLIEESIEARLSGDWTSRASGTPSDPLDEYRIKYLRGVMRTSHGAAIKAAYDAIDSTEQAERRKFLLAVAAKNASAIDPIAESMKREADAARAKIESAAASLSL